MHAIDFEYDGQYLSDYGFIICTFGGASDIENISAGSKISFNTVKRNHGRFSAKTSTEYEENISAEFSICKNTCDNEELKITRDEKRDIMRWLNGHDFLKFSLVDDEDESEPCFYYARMSIDDVRIDGIIYGFNLNIETNMPYANGIERKHVFDLNGESSYKNITDMSDDVGDTYPFVQIEIKEDNQNFYLNNDMTGCSTRFGTVKNGEVITLSGDTQIVSTSLSSHDICDDFNYDFFTIGNTKKSRVNKIHSNTRCSVTIKYSPNVKDSI